MAIIRLDLCKKTSVGVPIQTMWEKVCCIYFVAILADTALQLYKHVTDNMEAAGSGAVEISLCGRSIMKQTHEGKTAGMRIEWQET